MDAIEFGFDLATSFSIFGAAIMFIWTQATEGKRIRRSAIRQKRIENMSLVIKDFVQIIDKGHLIVDKFHKAAVRNEPGLITPDAVTEFCRSLDHYIEINTQLMFDIWASEEEKIILKDIQKKLHEWYDAFVAAHDNNEKSQVPIFNKLLEGISGKVSELSSKLRAEVEKIDI
jgi:hypothetical protein